MVYRTYVLYDSVVNELCLRAFTVPPKVLSAAAIISTFVCLASNSTPSDEFCICEEVKYASSGIRK